MVLDRFDKPLDVVKWFVGVQSNLSVCKSSDRHPRDPAVLQVSKPGWNNDLVQEVHPCKVMAANLDDIR